jgi:hypothetical protein
MNESAELIELTGQLHNAMETADMAFFGDRLSQGQGTLVIGTDPEEWWVGYDIIKKVFASQLKELEGISFTISDSRAYTEGSVGWIAARTEFKLPDGTVIPARLTAVCHMETGKWKFVQSHMSFGVPNEQAIGQELTIS